MDKQNYRPTFRITLAAAALLSLPACLEHPVKPVEYEISSVDEVTLAISTNRDVDILFVLDNSGSMGEEQANLAANFGPLIDVLEAPDVQANYRIGVTTTDNSNPWCGAATTPEAGALVASSCVDRPGGFVNQQGTLDVFEIACSDNCSLSDAELEIQPTTTERDTNPAPRPWLESFEGVRNIPDGINTTDAFACMGPQGIDGCGFESPLESMFKALTRFTTSDDPAFGFMRDDAILAIVHVTDEADCSYNNDWDDIFAQEGNRVFWDDPSDTFPTSAVCWNAGVSCTAGDGGLMDCEPGNYDIDGNAIAPDDPELAAKAVLHPVDRYIEQVRAIESAKDGAEVIVALIGGVNMMGLPQYADVQDPVFMKDFGIGPGCAEAVSSIACSDDSDCAEVSGTCGSNGRCTTTQTAVPPVRLAAFTEAFDGEMYSVCSDDYTGPMEDIADKIRQSFEPACFKACVRDTDLTTERAEPECRIFEEVDDEKEPVAECARDASGHYLYDETTNSYQMPNAEVHLCYAILNDHGGETADPYDDMHELCADNEVWNIQFEIQREIGFPGDKNAVVNGTCELATSGDGTICG